MVVKRKIDQLDHNANFIRSFVSVAEASRILKFDRRNISAVLCCKAYTSHGFIFVYSPDVLDGEVFKPHPFLPLDASNHGRIKFKDGSITMGYKQRNGYRTVGVCYKGRKYSKLVHRLIMECFEGVSSKQVDHINQISDDNRLENLQYMTAREHVIKTHSVNKK